MSTFFDPTVSYTWESIQRVLGIQDVERGGEWATGYRRYKDEFFLFANVGKPGRTGHDYENHWEDGLLVWEAKGPTTIDQPQIRRLYGGQLPVHLFTRENDRAAFKYEGLVTARKVERTKPVKIAWQLEDSFKKPLSADEVIAALTDLRFTVGRKGKKSQKLERDGTVLYVKWDSVSLATVIAGDQGKLVPQLTAIPGVRRPLPDDHIVHNQSFRDFPKRQHKGEGERPYGFAFDFDNLKALRAFVSQLTGEPDPNVEVVGALDDEEDFPPFDDPRVDPKTETEDRRARRLGQGKFRQDLIRRWDKKCALTGLDMLDILRASHIKPWCESSPTERHDVDNGLLLVVHIDCVFDRGLISFGDDGALILSGRLSLSTRRALGLDNGLRIEGLSDGNRRYLALHRERYFKG